MRKIFIVSAVAASLSVFSACGSETVASETPSTDIPTAAGNWEVDARDSHIKFTATQQGNEFTGAFTDFSADINFDSDNINDATVEAVIDLSSVDAGDSERNGALPSKDWFYIKKFPAATFTSDNFQEISDGEYEARGNLTIRDMTKPVTLPFTLNVEGKQAVMSGSVSLNRSDFGVGQGAWKTDEWVSLDVKVDVKITANKR